ncbi:MBL fold metallo-hydrolase [Leifsonia sp. NPDC080035]|uniref:MBL fold metallo-hydrolase n=1 Tax=Leifsonia sp. NPDC080035 TaxID=3143936 RepID=A0AAU7G991_9MICO
MLRRVAEGVLVHESTFCQSNAVVVEGPSGVLVIDAGVHEAEITCLAGDLAAAGETVAAGFSTHPHWDHLLWHQALGAPPRWATALGATTAHARLAGGIDRARFGIPEDVPFELLGAVDGLPGGTAEVPWDGPRVRIVEHRAHTVGHAALLIEERGVLVAGDMLSDVFVPMLDLRDATDPLGDYREALDLLEGVADGVEAVIPGHGSVGRAKDLRARIALDRAYVDALTADRDPDDPRVGPTAKPGWEFVGDVHARQVGVLADRRASDGAD